MQNKVKEFNSNMPCHRKRMPVHARIMDIQSELGELSKEVLKNSRYGTDEFVMKNSFKMEFGDVLYSMLSIACEENILADECLDMVLKKYEERIRKNNSMGSGK